MFFNIYICFENEHVGGKNRYYWNKYPKINYNNFIAKIDNKG